MTLCLALLEPYIHDLTESSQRLYVVSTIIIIVLQMGEVRPGRQQNRAGIRIQEVRFRIVRFHSLGYTPCC